MGRGKLANLEAFALATKPSDVQFKNITATRFEGIVPSRGAFERRCLRNSSHFIK